MNCAPPFYVNMSSVRPSGRDALLRWFTHAIEAKADAGVLGKIKASAAQRVGREERSTHARLTKMLKWLRRRGMLGTRKIENEVHLVVVDNAPLYQEKPFEQTHSPNALKLANALNAIGNEYGVYVHYVTVTQDAAKKLVGGNARDYPWAHLTRDGVFKMGPGEATNFGLSYILTHHEMRGGTPESPLFFFRTPDDLRLPLGRTRAPTTGKQHGLGNRNIFFDLEDANLRKILFLPGSMGYTYKGRKIRDRLDGVARVLFLGKPGQFTFYGTCFGGDMGPAHSGAKKSFAPAYLYQQKGSTWFNRKDGMSVFGRFEGGTPATKVSEQVVAEAMRRSGIKK